MPLTNRHTPTAHDEMMSQLRHALKIVDGLGDAALDRVMKLTGEVSRSLREAMEYADPAAYPTTIWLVTRVDGEGETVFAFSRASTAQQFAGDQEAPCVISTQVLDQPEMVEAITQ